MNQLKIREITIDDLDKVYELMNILYEGKLKYNRFKEIYNLKIQDKDSYYIVAVEGNNIVGVLARHIF